MNINRNKHQGTLMKTLRLLGIMACALLTCNGSAQTVAMTALTERVEAEQAPIVHAMLDLPFVQAALGKAPDNATLRAALRSQSKNIGTIITAISHDPETFFSIFERFYIVFADLYAPLTLPENASLEDFIQDPLVQKRIVAIKEAYAQARTQLCTWLTLHNCEESAVAQLNTLFDLLAKKSQSSYLLYCEFGKDLPYSAQQISFTKEGMEQGFSLYILLNKSIAYALATQQGAAKMDTLLKALDVFIADDAAWETLHFDTNLIFWVFICSDTATQNPHESIVQLKASLMDIAGIIATEIKKATPPSAPMEIDSRWMTNFSEARTRAQAEGKLMLVDFTASWCGPCKMLEKTLFVSPEFEEIRNSIVLVKIDCSTDENEASIACTEQFNIRAFPTILVVDPVSLEVRTRIEGAGEETIPANFKKMITAELGK